MYFLSSVFHTCPSSMIRIFDHLYSLPVSLYVYCINVSLKSCIHRYMQLRYFTSGHIHFFVILIQACYKYQVTNQKVYIVSNFATITVTSSSSLPLQRKSTCETIRSSVSLQSSVFSVEMISRISSSSPKAPSLTITTRSSGCSS